MIRPRRWLALATLLLLIHWTYGLPALFASISGYVGGKSAEDAQHVLESVKNTIAPLQPYKKRIVAVGDLHGDLAHASRVLRAAFLIDLHGRWVGGDVTLVQTGDIVDRGKDTIVLYQMMDKLREQARLAGGEVISLLGNHEFMNVLGDWRYVTPDDIHTFHGAAGRRKAFSTGWIGQTFLANYSVAARIPYSSDVDASGHSKLAPSGAVVAVHGGIHPSWANIDRINRAGHSLLQRAIDANLQLPGNTPAEERDFYSETGPVWYRGYALDDEADGICEQAESVLKSLNATRMVVGHTPHFQGILSRCRSKVIIIDTGISSAYGGVLSALEIMYTLTPVQDSNSSSEDGHQMKELEVVTAIYEGRREAISRKERLIAV